MARQGCALRRPLAEQKYGCRHTTSMELGVLDNPNLSFILSTKILEQANTALRYAVALTVPRIGKQETHYLIPDALFGLEYRHNGTRLYRFFLGQTGEPSQLQTVCSAAQAYFGASCCTSST